jgi:hypothetical protein
MEADTARRTLLARMESPLECPEERTGFAHADLLAWVRADRQRLAADGLTLLRGFVAAGRPDQKLPPWGSYEAWSNLIRNAIVWAGLADPAETRGITREADRSAEILALVHGGILEAQGHVAARGATAAELVRLVEHPTAPDEHDPYPTLRAATAELCGLGSMRGGLASSFGSTPDGCLEGGDSNGIKIPTARFHVGGWSICGDLRGLAGTFPTLLA